MSLTVPDIEIENSDLDDKIVENSGEPVPKPTIPSANESISSDPKQTENKERDDEVVGEGNGSGGGEDSGRGSCESMEKESAVKSERVEPVSGTELIELEGGTSRGEEEEKETSDVQSSASLPRKGTSEQDKPDNEDQSPSAKDFPVESQPSIDFVEIVLSHPCGSHFSRRLETQKTPEYGKIIREHVDIEIIRKRVEEGLYKSSRIKLFRDLLLLINNARVFYHNGSSEFNSAEQLHQLVKKQMTTPTTFKRPISPKEEVGAVSSSKPVSSKTRMSVPIIACRKRSSLAAKPLLLLPLGSSKNTDNVVDDEKLISDKDDETSLKDDDASLILKKMTRSGRTSSTKKVAIRNVKNRDSSLNIDDNEGIISNTKGSSKKKSAASFLERMKVVETLKPSSTDSSTTGKRGAEQRKNNSNKDDAKKRAVTGKKQTMEKASPAKKNNGRGPEREAARPSSSPNLAKRSRETSEKESASSSSTRLKKRARR